MVEIKGFNGLFALNQAVADYKRKQNLYAVPFYPMFWGTDQIFYSCVNCYRGKALKSGEIPFYCAQENNIKHHTITKAKIIKCTNCEFFQQR
jgi:hypothetical protein